MQRVYHIHDQCCGHASNTLDKIIAVAIKEGYRELFFTEHCPLGKNKYLWRPTQEMLTDLHNRIEKANIKYKGKLKIHFGYEAEYSKWNIKFFHNLTKDPLCDYLIFGNHYVGDMWKPNAKLVMEDVTKPEELDEYYENTVLALKSGIFSLYAHPDIFLQNYRKWDDKAKWLTKQIIELSIKYKVPLGFNANGLHQIRNDFNYPSRLFWKEVAKSKAKVLIEADAHHIPTLSKSWLEKAKREAIKYGLKKNLVDKIDIKYLH